MSSEGKSVSRSSGYVGWLLLVVAAALVAVIGRSVWRSNHAAPAGDGPTHWVAIGDAASASRTSGKPILYDFNAAWCPPCQALKREVFSDPSRASAVEAQVVPVTVVDRGREDGRNKPEVDELQRRFDVYALPTLVVLSPRTGRYEKREGYGDPQETLEWITRSARSVQAGASAP